MMTNEFAPPRHHAWQIACVLIGLGLAVFAIKAMFIAQYGGSTPYWDQWDAEANLLYKPYLESKLTWAGLLSAHNEHRILFSRLLSIALFELAGGWDPIFQMIVNAALHAGAVILLVLMLSRIVRRDLVLPLGLFAALLFALPIGWENLLSGFQAQFYMLLIFSFLALMGFANAPALGAVWWLSALCAVCAFFSMASGALVGFASFAVMLVQIVTRVRRSVRDYVAAALLLVMSVVMMAFIPHIQGHDVLKAHNAVEFAKAVLLVLNFPLKTLPAGVWINAPLAIYAIHVMLARPARGSPHWIVLSLIVWWFGQIVSLAYGRASGSTASRYLDIIMISLPVNFAILLFWLQRRDGDGQRFAMPLVGFWLFVTLSGLIVTTVSSALPSVVQKAAEGHQQRMNVVAYLQTGDLSVLQDKPFLAIPYPDPKWLAFFLSDRTIRSALPQAIRPADVGPQAAFERTLLKGRFQPIVAAVKSGLIVLAPAMAGLGIAMLFVGALIGWRDNRRPASHSTHRDHEAV